MFRFFSSGVWLVILWGLLVAVSLAIRPLFPIDETRYAAVAWEMWLRDDFLVPHLNGDAYSHKPPLLFWLIHLSWWLFGVNEWTLRIIAPLFSLGSLYLCRNLAGKLWPGRNQLAESAPFVLLGFFIWMIYSTLTLFDIMLSFFVLLGMDSLVKLVRSGLSIKRWGLFGLAIGGGILTKGPVILLHVLPIAILAPWWLRRKPQRIHYPHWYGGILLAVLIGALIALCWAIPAGIEGGESYRRAIFLGQTSGRIANSFAHKLPWWWYLQIIPLLLLPWLLFKPVWKGLALINLQDTGLRFCLAWAIPVFIAFSVVSGKRIHYLLPIVPALALIMAWCLDQEVEINWKRTHVPIMVFVGVLGLVLGLLPLLNDQSHWRDELSLISWQWGLLLGIIALIFGLFTAKNSQQSVFYVCIVSISMTLLIACAYFQIATLRYDTAPAAKKIAELMNQNREIAFYGHKYHGQYNFTGRLNRPISVISTVDDLNSFATQRESCYIIVTYKPSEAYINSIIRDHYPIKSKNIGLLSCQSLLENPALAYLLKPS